MRPVLRWLARLAHERFQLSMSPGLQSHLAPTISSTQPMYGVRQGSHTPERTRRGRQVPTHPAPDNRRHGLQRLKDGLHIKEEKPQLRHSAGKVRRLLTPGQAIAKKGTGHRSDARAID